MYFCTTTLPVTDAPTPAVATRASAEAVETSVIFPPDEMVPAVGVNAPVISNGLAIVNVPAALKVRLFNVRVKLLDWVMLKELAAVTTILDADEPVMVPEPEMVPFTVSVFAPMDKSPAEIFNPFTDSAPLKDFVPLPEIIILL